MRTFTIIIFALLGFQQKVNVLSNETGIICDPLPCDEYCLYGNIYDPNGDRTCICNDPCANVICSSPEVCKVEPLFCPRPPCGFIGICGPRCPSVSCDDEKCPYGFEYDRNKCRTCNCMDHCKNWICEPGKTCVIERLANGLFGIKLKCTKICEKLSCHLIPGSCQYGFEMDCDNCPTCNCKYPCGDVICPTHQYCSVDEFLCKMPPCRPPSASCKSYCPGNSSVLLGFSDIPVECSAGDWVCPKGYKCTRVHNLNESYCCRI